MSGGHGSIDWRTGIREIGILPARILPPGNRQSRSRPPTGKPRFGPQVGLARAFGGINAGASALRTDFGSSQLGSRWVLHREAGGDDELIKTHMRPRSKPSRLLAPRYTSGLACHTICCLIKTTRTANKVQSLDVQCFCVIHQRYSLGQPWRCYYDTSSPRTHPLGTRPCEPPDKPTAAAQTLPTSLPFALASSPATRTAGFANGGKPPIVPSPMPKRA